MKRIFLTLFIIGFFICTSDAQVVPSELWHEGRMVLLEGDTLKGEIKYNFKEDLAQIKVDDKIQTFSARKLFFFEIYDEGIKSYRQFYSLPYQVKSNYSVPMLFEVLYEGKLTLLCREKVVQEDQQRKSSIMGIQQPADPRMLLAFDFYFLEKDGKIKLYEPKKSFLLNVMDRRYHEMKKYIKKNNLRYDHISDLVRITAYYNALDNEQEAR